jgi:hypothetical protein
VQQGQSQPGQPAGQPLTVLPACLPACLHPLDAAVPYAGLYAACRFDDDMVRYVDDEQARHHMSDLIGR